ncbi:hypothetical protein AB0M96_24720, partial [Streptomyces sp. NPDC051098]
GHDVAQGAHVVVGVGDPHTEKAAQPATFAARSAAATPWIAAAPLGAHPALARLLLQRYDEALTVRYAAQRRELASV